METEVVSIANAMEGGAEPGLSPVGLLEIEAHIKEVAARYRVSPRLVAAIIEAESEFNPRAVSRRGARGLMQLMPATASSLRVENSFDPFENIEGGVRHLRRLIDRFQGNLPLALAAYNAGEQAVLAHRGIPPYRETRRYVARILRRIGYAGVIAMPASSRARLTVRAPQMVSVSSGRVLEMRPAVLVVATQLNAHGPKGPAPRVSAGPPRELTREPGREPASEPARKPARVAGGSATARWTDGQSP
jgi:hypothetical protein